MFNSVFFIVSSILGLSGFYFFKKGTKDPLNGVNWAGISIIIWMCFNAFSAAIINIFQIPINLISLGIIDFVLGIIFWFFIIKYKRYQHYFYNLLDILFIGIIILISYFFWRWQFGSPISIRYETSDPSIHFQMAREIINSQQVTGMYFSPLLNAILLEIISPFISILKLYKGFILIDFLMLSLSGIIFYITINKFLKNSFMKISGMLVTLFYMLGYPLNNMIFGFFYLGLGVTLICSLFFLIDCFLRNEIELKQITILVGLVTLGIILCYMLFAPVIYLATFICLIFYFFDKKQLFSSQFLKTSLVTLFIPGVIGLYYDYVLFFLQGGRQPAESIQAEGYIYRDLYSNFMLILPIAIFGLVKIVKKQRNNIATFTFSILLCFMGVLLIGGLNGKVSSYYFYKNHYLLWMTLNYLLIIGLFYLSQYSKAFISIYFSIWAFLACINFLGIENKIYDNNYLFDPVIKSSTFFDIYNFNKFILDTRPTYDNNKIELYKYVYSNLIDHSNDETRIPFAGDWLDCYWYEAITNQIGNTDRYWTIGSDVFIDEWEAGKLGNYIIVLYDGELNKNYGGYFAGLEKIFENPAGFIATIN